MELMKRKELKFQRGDLHLNESPIHKVLENGFAITPERNFLWLFTGLCLSPAKHC